MNNKILSLIFASTLILGACGADEEHVTTDESKSETVQVEEQVEEQVEQVDDEKAKESEYTSFIVDNGFEMSELYMAMSEQFANERNSNEWVSNTNTILKKMQANASEAVAYSDIPKRYEEQHLDYVKGSIDIHEGAMVYAKGYDENSASEMDRGIQLILDGGDARNNAVEDIANILESL